MIPVDVIIPLLEAPDNFEEFLKSYYVDIPINRLLIGNGGASSDLLEKVKTFPRTVIIDHTQTKSLGYSLQLLFDSVETEWFVYFHSDVSIPLGWYDEMSKYKNQYDWFECKKVDPSGKFQKAFNNQLKSSRSYSGSQMGKAKIFKNIRKIDDDYVARSEDEFFRQEIEKQGYQYGKVQSTFHYHLTYARKPYDKKTRMISAFKEHLKYFPPDISYNRSAIEIIIQYFVLKGEWDFEYWINWASKVNPEWVPFIKKFSENYKQKKPFIIIGNALGLKNSFIGKIISKYFFRV